MRTAGGELPACVLAVHRVVDSIANDHDTSAPTFAALLDRLVASGREVTTSLEADRHLQGRQVVLTFDDATGDHVCAAEQLHQRGLSGIFFVPSAFVGEAGHLTAGNLRHLRTLGHVIGSHSRHHLPLDILPPDELVCEVAGSKHELEQLLSDDVTYFSPPGGIGTPLLFTLLEEHGYVASRSMRWGLSGTNASRWDVPVVPVTELTVARGWVDAALFRGRLPKDMRAVRWVRGRVPPSARPRARRILIRLVGRVRRDVPEA